MAEKVCCSYRNVLSKDALEKELVRVACLYRFSTTKQVDQDEQNQADIPVQRKACHEFCDKMGWTIVIEEQEDGVSGFKVSASDRDKIQLLKEYAEQDKFDVLLVFMFDRIGRQAEETPFVVEWFVKYGIQVWSVNEGEQKIDTHADKLMNYIRFWQADGESQKTSIRTKTALAQMVQEGRFRGGVAPYGYRLVPSGVLNKRKHEVMKLEIIKAVQRESAFPMEILSELVNNARTKMLEADVRLSELTSELEASNQRVKAIKADYDKIMEWSEIFDASDMEVKKMIAGYIIKRVDVYSDYRLHIEFNMNFAQFELGLEIPNDYQTDYG